MFASRSKLLIIMIAFTVCVSRLSAHPCLCDGDANLDGTLDDADIQLVIACIGQPAVGECGNADLNCDGLINENDIDVDDPKNGDTAIVCQLSGLPPETCCPNHTACGSTAAGNCDEVGDTPACNDLQCCIDVCLADPFCCDFLWDTGCVAMAADICNTVATLVVTSSIPGADIEITIHGEASSTASTPFAQTQLANTEVTLTAPMMQGNGCFERWRINNNDMPRSQTTVSIDLSDDVSARAMYDCSTGDCDGNGVVNLDDYSGLRLCTLLSAGGSPPPFCVCVDFDADNDTDLIDFRTFQIAYSTTR